MNNSIKNMINDVLNIQPDSNSKLNEENQADFINVYNSFKNTISTWPKNNVEKTNIFINKNLNNQLKRLEKYGLTIENNTTFGIDLYDQDPNDSEESKALTQMYLNVLNNSNFVFKNQTFMATGIKDTKYYLNNRLLKNIQYKNRTYITVTGVNDQERVLQEEYKCPNCGNIVPISELLEGCKFCRTKFLISDLYPVVTNYYNCDMKKENVPFWPLYFLCAAVMIPLLVIFNISSLFDESSSTTVEIPPVAMNIFVGAVSSIVIAFFIKIIISLILFGKYVQNKNIKKSNYINLENFVRQMDPNFTYYMFEGKIISMLKETIFCDNCKHLNIYEGTRELDFTDILDVDFEEMYVKRFYVNGDCLYIDMELDLYITKYDKGKISRKEKYMCATVARKVNAITPSKFRFENVKCKTCGGNIDLINSNECTFCKNKYDYKDYDFVFTDLYFK